MNYKTLFNFMDYEKEFMTYEEEEKANEQKIKDFEKVLLSHFLEDEEVAFIYKNKLLAVDTIENYAEYLQYMPIKDGVNIIKYDNGIIGFESFYSGWNEYMQILKIIQ